MKTFKQFITESTLNPVFIEESEFVHMSANARSLVEHGWDTEKTGTVGGSLYKGLSVTLPQYVNSWVKIAKLGGTTPVTVKLPIGKKLIDFYKTFGSMDAYENKAVREWAISQGKWNSSKTIQTATYDEEGELMGWMNEANPLPEDETREHEGFSYDENEAIFASYIENKFTQACGVWYWDDDDAGGYSAPQGNIYTPYITQVEFSHPSENTLKTMNNHEW
tara:strand:+ start:627 stop:1289 length:663 start_codon:yes stop_codon:yes gene_type:complete